MRYLLDVNVLVALAFPSHVFHQRAHRWFSKQPSRRWATCALTQAGFLRTATRLLGNSRNSFAQALAGLERDCQSPDHEYWTVDADLRNLSNSQRLRLIGPNQIADMQLLAVARRHHGELATFDSGIRELASNSGYENFLLVL